MAINELVESVNAQPSTQVNKFDTILINNWKKSQALATTNHRVVKVEKGVANIYRPELLMRTKVLLHDGFYSIDSTNSFVRVRPQVYNISTPLFPDVDLFEPDLKRAFPIAKVPRETIRILIDFLVQSEQKGCATVKFEKHGLTAGHNAHNQLFYEMNLMSEFPFVVKLKNLRLALVEAMRYEEVLMYHLQDGGCPLFIGLNWEHCSLVATCGSFPHEGTIYG